MEPAVISLECLITSNHYYWAWTFLIRIQKFHHMIQIEVFHMYDFISAGMGYPWPARGFNVVRGLFLEISIEAREKTVYCYIKISNLSILTRLHFESYTMICINAKFGLAHWSLMLKFEAWEVLVTIYIVMVADKDPWNLLVHSFSHRLSSKKFVYRCTYVKPDMTKMCCQLLLFRKGLCI